MIDTVAVVVATFGDRKKWNQLASRAIASLAVQTRPPDEIIRIHRETLADARNAGARASEAEFLIFLDADDELEPGYIEAMLAAEGDLRYPRVAYVEGGSKQSPFEIPKRNLLLEGNYMVIGTMIRRDDFDFSGGFSDLPFFEDWELWIRMALDGCRPELAKDAVYVAHQQPGSRNQVESHAAEKLCTDVRAKYTERALKEGLL